MVTKKERANTFSLNIEKIVKDNKMTYMDAIVWYSHEKDMEPEAAAALLNKNIRNKLEVEARDLNFLPKVSKLPL
jgi:hypothetical protein